MEQLAKFLIKSEMESAKLPLPRRAPRGVAIRAALSGFYQHRKHASGWELLLGLFAMAKLG